MLILPTVTHRASGGGNDDPDFQITIDTSLGPLGTTPDFELADPEINSPVTVFWGDGSSDVISSDTDPLWAHTYSSHGIYNIRVSGELFRLSYFYADGDYEDKIISINNWGAHFGNQGDIRNFVVSADNFSGFLPTDNGFWGKVVKANAAFRNVGMSVPDVDMPNLDDGGFMFERATLLPTHENLVLEQARTLRYGFSGSSVPGGLISLPNLNLANLLNGEGAFRNLTVLTADYDNILQRIEANNPNDNVKLHFGDSKYSSAAQTARDNLVARGWTITDGGPA